ncbi:hypothetical protein [Flavobacterium hungaricum]|uniref:Lipoprotein n=1 Tax=Flavobacterium hungaricum TaxID=2082725 RepID=A0ABR9TME0_9FLAO|nr:hypothetical protein [Flavobacterium hungaricum]MBE8726490.1 hypothetical protein [Flavobacterium hungaricum]
MRNYFNIIIVFLILFSCNKIETGETLEKKDLDNIKSLKLLKDGEIIFGFYSEYKKSVAGSFFTNQRIASYWVDERNSKKNEINSAYYKEIVEIDTVFNAGATYTPYILVTKTNGKSFKVRVDGDKKEIKTFFEGAIRQWKIKGTLR